MKTAFILIVSLSLVAGDVVWDSLEKDIPELKRFLRVVKTYPKPCRCSFLFAELDRHVAIYEAQGLLNEKQKKIYNRDRHHSSICVDELSERVFDFLISRSRAKSVGELNIFVKKHKNSDPIAASQELLQLLDQMKKAAAINEQELGIYKQYDQGKFKGNPTGLAVLVRTVIRIDASIGYFKDLVKKCEWKDEAKARDLLQLLLKSINEAGLFTAFEYKVFEEASCADDPKAVGELVLEFLEVKKDKELGLDN